jgi:hypothetical protein
MLQHENALHRAMASAHHQGIIEAVLTNPYLDRDGKRAMLAAWASDARAVPDRPALRQLENGTVVELDHILRALRTLDDGPPEAEPGPVLCQALDRRRRDARMSWRRPRRFPGHDDDDPPPCPAIIAPRPVNQGGSAFASLPELACA